MKQKIYYITLGYLLTTINFILIGTRFNIVGLVFGLIAAICFIKALLIKK
jgi:hypothetical protein